MVVVVVVWLCFGGVFVVCGGKTQIFYLADRPFRHFGRVGRSKLW